MTHSPTRTNLGMRLPTMPLTMGPECRPTRSCTAVPVCGINTVVAACSMALANPKTASACDPSADAESHAQRIQLRETTKMENIYSTFMAKKGSMSSDVIPLKQLHKIYKKEFDTVSSNRFILTCTGKSSMQRTTFVT